MADHDTDRDFFTESHLYEGVEVISDPLAARREAVLLLVEAFVALAVTLLAICAAPLVALLYQAAF